MSAPPETADALDDCSGHAAGSAARAAPEMARALKAVGYSADIVADRTDEPRIHGSTGKVLVIV